MKCPICENEIKERDFYNISLTTKCLRCKSELVFSPGLIPMAVFLIISYFIWDSIPSLFNFFYDFIIGFVVVFLLMMAGLWIMLMLKLGKVIQQIPKDK